MDYKDVVNDTVERFEGSDCKDIDALYDCITDALTYDSAIYAVVEGLGSTCDCLNGQTLFDYAGQLLEDYITDNNLVECIDY